MSKTFDILTENGVFFISTINDNKPALRPFGAVMEYNDEIYFSTSNNKEVYKQIKINSNIEIVSIKAGSREWLRVNGNAIEVNDYEIKQIMLDRCTILNKRFDFNTSEHFALFKIINITSLLYTNNEVIDLY